MQQFDPSYHVAFTDLIDLAAAQIGGQTVVANDEFFAEKENLLKPGRGVFIVDKFTDRGKWMDGWETRRKRTPGHDWCIIKLGIPGIVRGVNVDTNHFIGNFPEACSIDGCVAPDGASADALTASSVVWAPILTKSRLRGGSQNLFAVASAARWTHLRLNIFPDGGVARLRVHGDVAPDWTMLSRAGNADGLVDVAAAAHGGVVLACNDMFFGPKDNLILPGNSINMGNGWETRRRRGAGHDWIVVRLARRTQVQRLEIDTHHFKGNFPDTCSVDVCDLTGVDLPAADFLHPHPQVQWRELLNKQTLRADAAHVFTELAAMQATHLRLNIYPDGGISRLRVFGRVEA